MAVNRKYASPKVVERVAEIRDWIGERQRHGNRVGLIPTMGALHAGHMSLVQAAKRECDVAVTTIFVNPTQFAPHEDFTRYPRDLNRDVKLLEDAGCDVVFAPCVEEIYPAGSQTFVEAPDVGRRFEGEFRPTHFRGVATVVLKLFMACPANAAFFGLKDYQQGLVVQAMTRDFLLPIEIRMCPIVREEDGLAMSSRNAYLSPNEREQALALSRSLQRIAERFAAGEREARTLTSELCEALEKSPGVKLDYADLADAQTLAPIDRMERPVVALVAARVGATRLIDNRLLDPASPSLK